MRVGLGLLNAGETSSYASISRIAQHAESLGYDSLWVTEREPFPLVAQQPCPVFTGELHVSRKQIDCTLDALAIAAINTEKISLGASLPNIPFYSPTDVGQSLAALDILSDGRMQVGLGLGWTLSEFQTVASALSRQDTPAAEFVRVLRTVWNGADDGFSGDHYVIPPTARVLTPIQRPFPPIRVMAFAPAAVQRPATLLRGGSPIAAALSSEEMAEALTDDGRVDGYELVVRAVVRPTQGPIGEARSMFSGTLEQIRDDIAFVNALGAAEVQFDLSQLPVGVDSPAAFALMALLRDFVPTTTAAQVAPFAAVAA